MFRSNTFRLILILLLISVIAVIIWSYYSRSAGFGESAQPSLLPEEISRQSTEFEYTQLKEGAPVFRVLASKSTITKSGEHQLEQVSLYRYDSASERTDVIEGRGALYRIDEKRIDFNEDVTIHLVNGTRIYADWAGADLEDEVVRIEGDFHFEQGTLTGSGGHLVYQIASKQMWIRRGLRLTLDNERAVRPEAFATEGTYLLNEGRVELRENTRIEAPAYHLGSERMEIVLGENQVVRSLDAIGDSELEMFNGASFSGARISLNLIDVNNRTITVNGELDSSAVRNRRAVYSRDDPAFRLESPLLLAKLSQAQGEDGSIVLDRLTGSPPVSLTSRGLGIEDGRAETFEALIDPLTGEYERIVLEGKVRILRRPDPSLVNTEEVLRCERFEINLGNGQQIQTAHAIGAVDFEMSTTQEYRRISADEAILFGYRDGVIETIRAEGGCVVMGTRSDSREVVRAPVTWVAFREGIVHSSGAEGGVDLEVVSSQGSRHTTSQEIELRYTDGRLDEAVQSGQFRLWQKTENGSMEIESNTARFDTLSRVMVTESQGKSLLRFKGADSSQTSEWKTEAKRLRLDQVRQRIEASEEVESVFELRAGPAVITSAEMEAEVESGWVTYRGAPRLVQGPNLVRADFIRINRDGEELQAEGQVESIIEEENGERSYTITSDRLSVAGASEQAVYEGNVNLRSEDMTLSAPRVVLFFGAGGMRELTRIEAEGGVRIVENGRTWEGRRATYFRKDDRVVVGDDR